jgi:hypothetical protein
MPPTPPVVVVDTIESKEKKIKNIQKKLKQIQELKTKQASGQALDVDQVSENFDAATICKIHFHCFVGLCVCRQRKFPPRTDCCKNWHRCNSKLTMDDNLFDFLAFFSQLLATKKNSKLMTAMHL